MINGVVFYQGPSQIDGQPIVAIATFKTANEKIGRLVQTWIIRSDIHPMNAINTGEDSSICGSCPLRGRVADASERTSPTKFPGSTTNKDRSCYVLVSNAPTAIWNTFKAGKYPELNESHRKMFMGKGLRYGAYGDPVAVPETAWKNLESFVKVNKRPGYTHQWKDSRFSGWSTRLMASTHTLAENKAAHAAGWRTFRTIASVDDLAPNEIICPASTEGGFTASCDTCGACNGRRDSKDQRQNVAIVAHGSGGKIQRVVNLVQLELSKVS
jgi:hypothetical protein